MGYGLLVGLASGIGASLFLVALEWLTYFVLDYLAGFPLGAPAGEHLVQNMPHGTPKLWLLSLAPAISGLLMASEMTRGYGLVVPLMFVSVITVLRSRRWSIYEKQLRNKFASRAHADELTINVVQTMQVREVYNPGRPGDPSLFTSSRLSANLQRKNHPQTGLDLGKRACGQPPHSLGKKAPVQGQKLGDVHH